MLTEREFREAVERYRDTVFRVAFAYMRSAADAGTVKILAHFPTAPRPAVRCGYSSSSVTSR